MGRTGGTVSVTATVSERPNHRTKIKATNSQFAGQFVSQDFSSSSKGQKKSINFMLINKLSQILFYQVQIGIKIPAVVSHLVIKNLCPLRPIVFSRLLKLRRFCKEIQQAGLGASKPNAAVLAIIFELFFSPREKHKRRVFRWVAIRIGRPPEN